MSLAALPLAYFLGSIPFGFLLAKLKGIDIRQHGSGNIGATNVFRVCGKSLGIPVFILDFLKGLASVLIAERFGQGVIPVAAGILAVVGHNFPFWLRFKGGKGIATSAGVLAALLPLALLGALIIWLLTFVFTRYVSVASIASALTVPIVVCFQHLNGHPYHMAYLVFAFVVCVMAVWRHRGNIQRLIAGTESRVTRKAKSTESSPNT